MNWSGVATAGVDTSALPASVTVGGGTSSTNFTVTATDDYLKEGSESLIATITGVTDTDSRYEAVAIGSSNVANSAITDETTPAAPDTVYAHMVSMRQSVAEGGVLTYP